MRNRPIYDIVALLARCGVGAVFVAHGWQKIQVGITATGRNLDAMGAPFPTFAAVYSTFAELLCGTALILGVALPVAGALLFLDMAGALVFVHAKHGIFLVDKGNVHNGFELVLVLGLASLVFAAGGGGRLTLDRRIFGSGRRQEPSEEDEPGEYFRALQPPKDAVTPEADPVDLKQPIGAEEPPSATHRPGSDLVTDTSRDVIVAGGKAEPSSDDTAPVRTRKRRPKAGA
jgi:putative oxidoreductase